MSLAKATADRGRFTELEPIAVIDIGSNSVRLVVYEGAVRSPVPLFNEKVSCGLGRSVATTGRLGAESVGRALEALSRFKSIIRILGVKTVHAIATAAVREASDGPDFIARASQAAGVPIQILSGIREAELAAGGIQMGFVDPVGVVGDLGGGSLELMDLTPGRGKTAVTLPLGGLRLIDLSGGRVDKAMGLADEHVARVPWLPQSEGRSFYAVGGTWRALAKLHMETNVYPLHVMHGYRLSARQVLAFCETLRSPRKLADLLQHADIAKARREVLPYGALVLESIVRRMKPADVVFSVFGIREGLLHALLSAEERTRDPLIAFSEDYARLRSRSVVHARELCRWTDTIFTEPGPAETPIERRLRHAACLLSDIGWRAHPDYRGEQSLYVIAHAALAGVDHPERIFLALTVYYRHVGTGEDQKGDDLIERLKAIVPKRIVRRARILGAAIRAAHMLSIGMPGIIQDVKLFYEGDRIVMVLPKSLSALNGERLQRRFEVFARLIDRRPQIRLDR